MNTLALLLALCAPSHAATFELSPVTRLPATSWKIDLDGGTALQPALLPLGPKGPLPLTASAILPLSLEPDGKPPVMVKSDRLGPILRVEPDAKPPVMVRRDGLAPVMTRVDRLGPLMKLEPDAKPPVKVRGGREAWLEKMFDRVEPAGELVSVH